MRHAICYISRENCCDLSLLKILMKESEVRNNSQDIKGLLLHSDGNFFHIMEGEKKLVQELFFQIQNDTRHKNLVQILGKDVTVRGLKNFRSQLLGENSEDNSQLLSKCLSCLNYLEPDNKLGVQRIIRSFFQPG